jgi:hypothetical protein
MNECWQIIGFSIFFPLKINHSNSNNKKRESKQSGLHHIHESLCFANVKNTLDDEIDFECIIKTS